MRLIDADALKASYIVTSTTTNSLCHLYVSIEDINSAPTIDAVEVVRGERMPIIEANEFGEVYQVGIYCSECGETLGCETNFCPNCGADMRAQGE